MGILQDAALLRVNQNKQLLNFYAKGDFKHLEYFEDDLSLKLNYRDGFKFAQYLYEKYVEAELKKLDLKYTEKESFLNSDPIRRFVDIDFIFNSALQIFGCRYIYQPPERKILKDYSFQEGFVRYLKTIHLIYNKWGEILGSNFTFKPISLEIIEDLLAPLSYKNEKKMLRFIQTILLRLGLTTKEPSLEEKQQILSHTNCPICHFSSIGDIEDRSIENISERLFENLHKIRVEGKKETTCDKKIKSSTINRDKLKDYFLTNLYDNDTYGTYTSREDKNDDEIHKFQLYKHKNKTAKSKPSAIFVKNRDELKNDFLNTLYDKDTFCSIKTIKENYDNVSHTLELYKHKNKPSKSISQDKLDRLVDFKKKNLHFRRHEITCNIHDARFFNGWSMNLARIVLAKRMLEEGYDELVIKKITDLEDVTSKYLNSEEKLMRGRKINNPCVNELKGLNYHLQGLFLIKYLQVLEIPNEEIINLLNTPRIVLRDIDSIINNAFSMQYKCKRAPKSLKK